MRKSSVRIVHQCVRSYYSLHEAILLRHPALLLLHGHVAVSPSAARIPNLMLAFTCYALHSCEVAMLPICSFFLMIYWH